MILKKLKSLSLMLLLMHNIGYSFNYKESKSIIEKDFQQTISGVITDDMNIGLPGANVAVKNNPLVGTSTDADGNFSIETTLPTTLVISYLGFKTQEVTIEKTTNSLVVVMIEDSFFMEDIIVTARKRPEKAQEIPISITTLKSEKLAEMGVNDLTGITNVSPNVTFTTAGTTSGSSSNAVVYIRGIGQNFYSPNLDAGAGIYVDEIYLGRSIGAVLDIADLKSIEVIRGPQGTLFGRNTIAGAISLTTADPGDKFSGRISYTDGTYGRNDVVTALRGPVSDDIGLAFSFVRRNRDGYVERVNVEDSYLGNDNSHAFRAKVKIGNPDKKFGLTLIGDYAIEREESAPEENLYYEDTGVLSFWNLRNPDRLIDQSLNAGDYKTGETSLSQNDIDSYGMSANIKYDLNEHLESKLILSYRNLEAKFARQVDGTDRDAFQNRDQISQNQMSADLRLTREADKLDFVAGVFYFKENIDQLFKLQIAGPPTPYPYDFLKIQNGGDLENFNYAAYGEINYKVFDQLSASAGIRYTNETKRFKPNAFSALPTDNIEEEFSEPAPLRDNATNRRRFVDKIWQENNFDQITWRGSLRYMPSEYANIYASVSTGFKSGGIEGTIANDKFYKENKKEGEGDLPQFDPETVTTYELGTKLDLNSIGLKLNVAAFLSDYRGFQIGLRRANSIAGEIINAAKSEIKGTEVELRFNPISPLLLDFTYGYTDAQYKEVSENFNGLDVNDKFILTPEHSVSGAISYRFDLKSLGSLTPTVNGHYNTEIHFEPANSEIVVQKPYAAFDAALKYKALENWELVFGVNNITNKRYLIGGDSNTGSYETGIFSRPINYFGTLSYIF